MALRTAVLRVHSNPWHAVDHLGRPAGACPKERSPHYVNSHQGFVGAECVASAPTTLPSGHAGTPDQDTCWHFQPGPVELQDSAYYRGCVARGELIAADDATARKCGVKFVAPAEALAKAKADITATWRANFGEDLPKSDPFKRPEPAGKISPLDADAASGAERSKAAAPAQEGK